MRFLKKILFDVTKPLSAIVYLGSSLTKQWQALVYRSTEQLAAPILATAKMFGATGHL